MSPSARSLSARLAQGDAADPFAAFWQEPVPSLRPLGAARVIHSWEAPHDLWRKDDDAETGGAVQRPTRSARTSWRGASARL